MRPDERERRLYLDAGGPAFPSREPPDSWGSPDRGMTLRDWFAGQALSGLLAGRIPFNGDRAYTDAAYRLADTMLASRQDTPA